MDLSLGFLFCSTDLYFCLKHLWLTPLVNTFGFYLWQSSRGNRALEWADWDVYGALAGDDPRVSFPISLASRSAGWDFPFWTFGHLTWLVIFSVARKLCSWETDLHCAGLFVCYLPTPAMSNYVWIIRVLFHLVVPLGCILQNWETFSYTPLNERRWPFDCNAVWV